MFDNPNRELRRLEDQLLAAEEPPESEEAETPEQALADVKRILARDSRKPALSQNYVAKKNVEQLHQEQKQREKLEKIRNSKSGGLIAALLLEFAALMGVIAWWILAS